MKTKSKVKRVGRNTQNGMSVSTYEVPDTVSMQPNEADKNDMKDIKEYMEETVGEFTTTGIIRFGLRKGAEFVRKQKTVSA